MPQRKEFFSNLSKSLEKAEWHPEIRRTVLLGVRYWFRDQPPPVPDETHAAVIVATQAQEQLGWGGFIRGFVSKQWLQAQEQLSHMKYDTGQYKAMYKAIIRPCLEFFFSIWKHRNGLLHGNSLSEC